MVFIVALTDGVVLILLSSEDRVGMERNLMYKNERRMERSNVLSVVKKKEGDSRSRGDLHFLYLEERSVVGV